jgi:hypothetical protein
MLIFPGHPMPNDTLRIMCPNLSCRKILAVPSNARGKTVKCRSCSTSIRIPENNKMTGPGPRPAPSRD